MFDVFLLAEQVCLITEVELDIDAERVNCGEKIFYYCEMLEAKKCYEVYGERIEGVQFYFREKKVEDLFALAKVEQYWQMQIDGALVYCAYTPLFHEFEWVDGKKINMQVAVREGNLVCGFPVILTGF